MVSTAQRFLRDEAFARLDALKLDDIQKLTWTKLASLANTSVPYVRKWAQDRGHVNLVSSQQPHYATVKDLPLDHQKVITLYDQEPRLSVRGIARETNISNQRLRTMIRRLIELKFLVERGHPARVISEAQLARLTSITKCREAQETWDQIGIRLGISRQAVKRFWVRFNHLAPKNSDRP